MGLNDGRPANGKGRNNPADVYRLLFAISATSFFLCSERVRIKKNIEERRRKTNQTRLASSTLPLQLHLPSSSLSAPPASSLLYSSSSSMAPHPKDTSHAPLPLPTSRISRLFRPFLTKLASLDSLFLNSAPIVPPPMATRSTRTYSKNDAAKSGDYSGSAKGLPVFERGKKFKRATPRSMPKELIAIPPPSGNKQRPTEKAISNSRLPQLPSIEMAEVS